MSEEKEDTVDKKSEIKKKVKETVKDEVKEKAKEEAKEKMEAEDVKGKTKGFFAKLFKR